MTAPLDFSTVTDAMPAFAFGLAGRIGYEAFGVLPADMAGKSLGLDRVRELLALRDAAIRNEATKGMGKKAAQQHMARIHRIPTRTASAPITSPEGPGKGIDMAFSRTLTIAQWRRDVPSLMEAKSHLLHGPMRQTVPTSPELVDKRRRAEERKLLAELSGSDVK